MESSFDEAFGPLEGDLDEILLDPEMLKRAPLCTLARVCGKSMGTKRRDIGCGGVFTGNQRLYDRSGEEASPIQERAIRVLENGY